MQYIVIELFPTPFVVTDQEGESKIFESFTDAESEASDCQKGLVVPISTDRLFTKAQMLDVLVSFDQSLNPEEYSSSKELGSEDFMDAALCKALVLDLEKEFNIAKIAYANGSGGFIWL
jgi:hypothetical protein